MRKFHGIAAATAFALSVCAAAAAPAPQLATGQYGFWLAGNPVAFGKVCLESNQNWYGLTFDGGPRTVKWGGFWASTFGDNGDQIRIVGSYENANVIPTHDDITIDGRSMKGDWMTWSDTKNFWNDRLDLTMKFEKRNCDPQP